MLAALISDCGLVTYGNSYWNEHSRDDAVCDQLIADAERFMPGYASNVRRMLALFGMFNLNEDYLRKQRCITQTQYDDVYGWFTSPHVDDWLGAVPADIIGVIGHYLCVLKIRGCTREITMFGRLHSHLDAPSVAIVSDEFAIYEWHQRGLWHRGDKPAMIHAEDGRVKCYWYAAGQPVLNSLGIDCLTIYDDSSYEVGHANTVCALLQPETVDGIADLAARLWVEYGEKMTTPAKSHSDAACA